MDVGATIDDDSSKVLEVSTDSDPVDVCLVPASELLGIVEIAD